jgi:hypothetical protein
LTFVVISYALTIAIAVRFGTLLADAFVISVACFHEARAVGFVACGLGVGFWCRIWLIFIVLFLLRIALLQLSDSLSIRFLEGHLLIR